jgi:hypothetical protein
VLSTVVSVVGAVLVLASVVAAIVGGVFALFIPQLLLGGLLLLVGLAIERWRYKPIVSGRPNPGWTDTGERFVDPETSVLTAVYLDAATGERHYLAIDK